MIDIRYDYQIPDELWKKLEPLLPPPKPKKKLGRPRMDDRIAMTAIFYVLRTGCQWKALPRSLGASSTVHDRFQEWRDAGVFEKLWKEGLLEYDKKKGIDWEWQSMDGAMTKAPLGGESTGANPTDRGKKGTKRSLMTDGKGIPLALVVDGANRHDKMLVKCTLDSIMIERPDPEEVKQNMCMDKGYDYPDIRGMMEKYGYTAHICTRGDEKEKKSKYQGIEQGDGLWKGRIHG